MRLGIKLAALAMILLLPKTTLYFSNTGLADAQIAPERPISGPTVDLKPVPTDGEGISAERKQAQIDACAAANNVNRSAVLLHVAGKAAAKL